MINDHKKWWVLFSTGIMIILVNLDMTIVNLALPKMAIAFHANINETQWIITSYLLATVLFFTVFGRLADMFGRRRIFLLGVFLFTLGSLLAGFAPSMTWLMVGRFVQGLGFAATLGLSFVIIFASFPEEQRGFASGLGVGIAGISQALGPTVGGLVVQYANWPWVFLINVPLGILSLVMVYYFVPHDDKRQHKQSLSLSNAALFIAGLLSILYAVNQFALLKPMVITIMIVFGLLLLTAFYLSSHKMKNPMINVDLLKHRNFILLSIIRCFVMMLFNATLFIVPLYLQNILDFSPEKSGLMLLSLTALIAITSPIAGKLVGKIGYMKPIIMSMGLALSAVIVSYFVSASGTLAPLFISLGLLGIALGINIPATLAAVNKMVPEKDAGTAMGLFFTLAIIGAMLGVALVGNLLSTLSASYLTMKLGISTLPSALMRAASGADNIHALPIAWHPVAADAFIYAYHNYMLVMLMTMLIASGLTLVLNKWVTLETSKRTATLRD